MLSNEILRNHLISRRTFIIGAGKLGLMSLLLSRLFYIQLIKEDEYKMLSDKNCINLIIQPPIRGKILDVNGKVIAHDVKCFRLLLDKKPGTGYAKDLELLFELLELSSDQKLYILNKIKKASIRVPVTILTQLNWKQIAVIEERKINLSSIFIDTSYIREYPIGISTSHLIGYVGQVNEEEKQELMLGKNINDFNIGKTAIEKYYEKKLQGEFGYKQVEVNAYGKYVREVSRVSSKPGENLQLNIDSELQEKIYPYLNKNGSSAIVMDTKNGNILILAATPSYDSNNFIKLSQEYWTSLISNPYKPLINKSVQNSYAPGSIFKIITVLAALESGISPDKIVYCTGASALANGKFHCHNKNGHGGLNMMEALKYSCNSYMYEISKLIGPDKILSVAKKFGFGELTGIDITGEVFGFLPSRNWKKLKHKHSWTLGDTLNLSIGQGFILATPIQLARFAACIASNGKLFTPCIAKSNETKYRQVDISKDHLGIIKEAMFQTVNNPGGAAYNARIPLLKRKLAGKTGTSQVLSKANANDDLSKESVLWKNRNHAIFIGFGPYEDPKYSVAVFVDHGGGGGRVAAPVATHIMSEVFCKYCT